MSRFVALFDYAAHLVGAAILCLLPRAERERWTRRFEAPMGAGNAVIAGAELIGGAWLWGAGFLRFATSVVEFETSTVAVGPVEPRDAISILTLAGPLTFLAFVITPMGVLATYIVFTGVVRAVAQAAAREIVGEPLVTLCFWLWRKARESHGRATTSRRFGPLRPDRVIAEGAGRLAVLSCREKPEWNKLVTIQVGDRFYRVEGVEERNDGDWAALAYRLTEYEPHGVIRGLIVHSGETTAFRPAPGLSIAEGLAPNFASGPDPMFPRGREAASKTGRDESDRQADPHELHEAELEPVAPLCLDRDSVRRRR